MRERRSGGRKGGNEEAYCVRFCGLLYKMVKCGEVLDRKVKIPLNKQHFASEKLSIERLIFLAYQTNVLVRYGHCKEVLHSECPGMC